MTEEWKEFHVPQEEIDVYAVLTGGQSFRWKKSAESPEEIVGVFGHRLWVLKQTPTKILYKVFDEKNKNTNDKVDTEKLLHAYFQLDVDLPSLYKKWAEKDTRFASLTKKDYQGIRILSQDPLETIFCFICSSNNNIQRISQMVDKLCKNYGERITSYKGQEYFDFPKVERLVGENVEKKLREE